MKLRALCSINSGKINTGDIFETNDVAGQSLISSGAAKQCLGNYAKEKLKHIAKGVVSVGTKHKKANPTIKKRDKS